MANIFGTADNVFIDLNVLDDLIIDGNLSGRDLTLTGNIKIPTTTSTNGKILQNGNPFLHSFGASNNVFLGNGSGNFTNTSSGNVGIGPNTAAGLTSGNFNIAIGNGAMRFNTTGAFNVALGQNALSSATMTGSENLGIGASACSKVTSGLRNTGIGNGALLNTLTGFGNTAIGYLAGQSINGAEQFNTYIGYNVAGIAGESNTTRIGFPGSTANYNYGVYNANLGATADIIGITSGSRLGTVATKMTTSGVINSDNSYQIQNNPVHDLGAMYVYNGSLMANIQNGGTQSSFLLPAKPSSTYTLATYDDIILAYISYFSTDLTDVTTVTGGTDTAVIASSLSATLAEVNFKYLGNTNVRYDGNDTIYAEVVGSVSFFVPDGTPNDIKVKLMQDDVTEIGGNIVSAYNNYVMTVSVKAIVKFGQNTTLQLFYNALNSTDITTKCASITVNNI